MRQRCRLPVAPPPSVPGGARSPVGNLHLGAPLRQPAPRSHCCRRHRLPRRPPRWGERQRRHWSWRQRPRQASRPPLSPWRRRRPTSGPARHQGWRLDSERQRAAAKQWPPSRRCWCCSPPQHRQMGCPRCRRRRRFGVVGRGTGRGELLGSAGARGCGADTRCSWVDGWQHGPEVEAPLSLRGAWCGARAEPNGAERAGRRWRWRGV
mmetsp:Transcript_101986/g.292648  ORF Transcript_101986/g.292648 Transcript_101986/m.292648 type:complete len:208 (-) Transcript_101986:545-1168(-)